MYQIDAKVPAPNAHGKGRSLYPFKTMKVGDSFFVPNTDKPKSAIVCACNDQRKTRRKYQSAQVTENRIEGVRIWRMK